MGPTATDVAPTFVPVADHALLVSFGTTIGDAASAAVLALDRALAGSPPEGMTEVVPAFVNLLIDFDPVLTDHARVREHVERLLREPPMAVAAGGSRVVDVCYDGEFAPDLEAVARATARTVDAVIALHLGASYRVGMYGFAPGYAYLSGVPEPIQVPRKPVPVRDVPAGAVLIAGPQCLVTTLAMPTGWSIIGRSPTRILGSDEHAPVLFDIGDTVRFRRIDRARYDALRLAAREA